MGYKTQLKEGPESLKETVKKCSGEKGEKFKGHFQKKVPDEAAEKDIFPNYCNIWPDMDPCCKYQLKGVVYLKEEINEQGHPRYKSHFFCTLKNKSSFL